MADSVFAREKKVCDFLAVKKNQSLNMIVTDDLTIRCLYAVH